MRTDKDLTDKVTPTDSTDPTETSAPDLDEFQLIAVTPTAVARSRDFHEGLKAKASDVHNWNNRITL